jgi:hypothetical protein
MSNRTKLSISGMLHTVRACFGREKLRTLQNSSRSLVDYLMSGLAVFNLKFASLLQFDQNRHEPVIRRNLKNLFGVTDAPSDTSMRERLDELSPQQIRKPYKVLFAQLQRVKLLDQLKTSDGYYILSGDGTGHYSSGKVSCDCCCIKHHHNGSISYYHQMYAGALVHPDKSVVIPLAPEPITKADGDNKNDCERNASKRFFTDFRREHPHLKTIVVEDALAANQPHLSLLDSLNLAYIVGVKKGDHKYLFNWMETAEYESYEIKEDLTEVIHQFKIYQDAPLNATHQDYRVTVLEYWEIKPDGSKQYFSWVTKLTLNKENVYERMRQARARWKIENETFNTLKNQGYNFGHSYGHGKKHLCSVLGMLMMLSFLIDQIQQLCDIHYQRARKKAGALYALQEKVRVLVQFIIWESWEQLYSAIAGLNANPPPTA